MNKTQNRAVLTIGHERRLFPCISAIGIMLAVLAWSGCSGEEKPPEPVVNVQAAAAQQKTIQRTVTSEAVLFPLHQAAIVPKITAPVRKFYVNRGNHVRAGQLLAVLENRDLSAGAVQSKGEYEQAEASYTTSTGASIPEEMRKAELDESTAKQNLDAEEKLFESRQKLFEQGALPRKDLDQARVALAQAKSQYDIAHQHLEALLKVSHAQALKAATGQLTAAKGKYQGAAALLSYSEIRSPINGLITDRPIYPGETPAAGMPLLMVMDTSSVIAKAHIPQEEAALLKVGDPGTITAAGVEDELKGKVTVVSPALDPNSTTVEVWVQARNPKGQLKPGSSVQVSMLAEVLPNAVTIPATALLTESDGTTSVMVVGDDGRAHQRDVKPGVKQGDELQIAEGLKPGERVVTVGAYGLPDNTKVRIEAASAQNAEPDKPKKGDAGKDEKDAKDEK
ncbi:MAG TPA: efflux RND transporter periplasmic adaptor subunit [Terriglobales bacterium]|nr:efflux RND transporter periplasmic adaptor subunit [Terriglobales bacterium]